MVLLAAGVLLTGAPAASGHAFLVDTRPVQDERLAASPAAVAIEATEPLARIVDFELRRSDGSLIESGQARLGDQRHTATLRPPALDEGVYVAAWHVVSAVDGHETAGEFAFAVGDPDAGVPGSVSSGGSSVAWWAAAGSWLFFLGLALAGGMLLAPWLLTRAPPAARHLARGGILLAAAGVVLRGAGAATPGVAPGPDLLIVGLLTAAMLAVTATRRLAPSLLLLAGAAAGWSTRGHVASAAGPVGAAVDFVHLAAGSLWAGTLGVVALAWWRARPAPPEAWLLAGTARYARLALGLVAALVLAGVVAGWQVLARPGDLWATGYGWLLVAKSVAAGAAVAVALLARTRGLGGGRHRLLPRLTMTEAGLVATALALAGLLVSAAPPGPGPEAGQLLGPPPLRGGIARAAGLAGEITVAVAAGPDRVEVEALGPAGGLEGARVAVVAEPPSGSRVDLRPRPCGAGCFTQRLSLPRGTTRLEVTAAAPGWRGGTVVADIGWPPPPEQPRLLEEAVARLTREPQVWLAETVSSSGPPRPPPRAADRAEASSRSGRELVDLLPYGRARATEVRPRGGDSRSFTFFLPGSRLFGTVWLDDQRRIRRVHLVNPGHEIEQRFAYPR